MTLESAIEFIGADELVEVTPTAIRLRKRMLSLHDRRRERGREDVDAPPTRGRSRGRLMPPRAAVRSRP